MMTIYSPDMLDNILIEKNQNIKSEVGRQFNKVCNDIITDSIILPLLVTQGYNKIKELSIPYGNNMPTIYIGKGDPNNAGMPDGKKDGEILYDKVLSGYYESHMKSMSIVYLYSIWEHSYRNKVKEFTESDGSCPIFGDIRIIRNNIMHVNGIYDGKDKLTLLNNYFEIGKEIKITSDVLEKIREEIYNFCILLIDK